MNAPPLRLPLADESDVAIARLRTRRLAVDEGFTEVAAVAVATAVSELAQNVLVHARSGEVELGVVQEQGRRGVMAIVRDEGPGIADRERAMQDGYSTTRSLGLGLPSARRLVGVFDVVSAPGVGTTVTVKKWKP